MERFSLRIPIDWSGRFGSAQVQAWLGQFWEPRCLLILVSKWASPLVAEGGPSRFDRAQG